MLEGWQVLWPRKADVVPAGGRGSFGMNTVHMDTRVLLAATLLHDTKIYLKS
jgi:hypothetical protein